MSEERCVCCGAVIPEGRQICGGCEIRTLVRCGECDHGSHVDTPEGRVWCEKMCRYMVVEGFCSFGKKKVQRG